MHQEVIKIEIQEISTLENTRCSWQASGTPCHSSVGPDEAIQPVLHFGVPNVFCAEHRKTVLDVAKLDRLMMPEYWSAGRFPMVEISEILNRLHKDSSRIDGQMENPMPENLTATLG